MTEWFKRNLTFPNPAANCVQVYIQFSSGFGAAYYPVEGGYRLDRYRANAKLYTSESEIRFVLLKQLLKQARKVEREISDALAIVSDKGVNDAKAN